MEQKSLKIYKVIKVIKVSFFTKVMKVFYEVNLKCKIVIMMCIECKQKMRSPAWIKRNSSPQGSFSQPRCGINEWLEKGLTDNPKMVGKWERFYVCVGGAQYVLNKISQCG